jgi:hypothetical protein
LSTQIGLDLKKFCGILGDLLVKNVVCNNLSVIVVFNLVVAGFLLLFLIFLLLVLLLFFILLLLVLMMTGISCLRK